jgi:hypothetical protein
MSMNLSDADVAALTVMLAPERLAALTELTGSARLAIELHQETLRVGAALMNVTATIEIALRNALCENLGNHFGTPHWFLQPPAPFEWKESERRRIPTALDNARRAAYSKLTQAEKVALDELAYPNGRPPNVSHLQRAKARRQKIIVTEGKVIAEMTLHFWKKLYGPEYEQDLWRPSLKRTFPCKRIKRADVAIHLENIYQSRNRLAHHEPVLHRRFTDTVESICFIAKHLNTANPSDETALARLIASDVELVTEKGRALHEHLDSFRIIPQN